MSFFASLRRRLKNTPLESNQIDDDYSEPISPSLSIDHTSPQHELPTHAIPTIANNNNNNNNGNANNNSFDPNEIVPSYETSQRLHYRSSLANDIFINDQPSIPVNHPSSALSLSRIYAPIPSLPIPLNMSRSSSSSSLNSHRSDIQPSQSAPLPPHPSHAPHPPQQLQPPTTHKQKKTIKQLGLRFLNSKQHFALAFCRDVSLIPAIYSLFQSWKRVFHDDNSQAIITTARGLEHFLTGMWCIVAAYLNYSVLDGLIIRWIVTYLTLAAIVRVLSLSTMSITVELYLVSTFTAQGYKYGLHIWILISCILTLAYIVQNFVTSNIDIGKDGGTKKRRGRVLDMYNIVVFAVVPVGLASFVTMIGLLRSLLILRIDVDQALNGGGGK